VKATEPATDVKAAWAVCSPKTVGAGGWAGFSAAGYYFGRQLHKDLGVPVGLIDTTWGGTPAEFWTSNKSLEADPALKPLAQGESSCLYNGMLAPLIPFGIRGAVWYQGESNAGRAYQYRTLFPAMIRDWRTSWGQGDFPFGFVQIAPYRYGGQNNTGIWAELSEAQTMTLKNAPNTGMAVTLDIGNIDDIHPTNKQEVGRRLALWAMAKAYGKETAYSGPIYKSMAVDGNKVRLEFDHVGGGLVSRDGKPLTDFTVAGADQQFKPANAEIDGNSVVVTCPEVAEPAAVRFAWHDIATPNLSNKDGLPAGPFRTDSWKGVTEGK
jgi:sialate O-acetylesterase